MPGQQRKLWQCQKKKIAMVLLNISAIAPKRKGRRADRRSLMSGNVFVKCTRSLF
jgi:hypothetical protein